MNQLLTGQLDPIHQLSDLLHCGKVIQGPARYLMYIILILSWWQSRDQDY